MYMKVRVIDRTKHEKMNQQSFRNIVREWKHLKLINKAKMKSQVRRNCRNMRIIINEVY